MSRKTMIIAVVSALLLGLGAWPAGAAPADPFLGVWESVDIDGSNQRLSFGGGGTTKQVNFRDDNATGGICESGGGWFMARGTGEVDGDTISGVWESENIRCQDRTNVTDDVDFEFVHDPETDTLSDPSGVTWFRSGQ
ncbi:MAG: hypothetical protein ACRDHV_02335 [Actinomycetota bacterium]